MADRTVVYRLTANITGLKAQMAQAGASVKGVGDKMTAAGKDGEKFRKGLDTVGRTAGRIGLVAAAGLGATVLAAANFDKSMSAVQAATHETAANMELLRSAAIKAGADTQYSATEAAGAIEELAKAGVSTKDVLGGGLAGALNLAAAGGLEVSDAAEIAASALTQFALAGKDVPHVADLLAAGAGKAQGSVQDLGYALKYAGVPAHSLGISIEETTGVLAEFASAGIVGEQAGTTLRSMLLSLAAPTHKARELMDGYGISLYDSQGKFIGLQGAADVLRDKLGPLDDATRNAALSTIFGTNAIQGAIQLYNGGGAAVEKWTNNVNDSGYAAETAATRMDNLAGDIEQFKGSLETALIGAGEGAQGPLRSIVQNATQAVNALNGLPQPAKNVGSALLGITAVTGGGIYFGSKVVAGIASMRTALKALGIEATTAKAKLSLVGTGAVAATLGVETLFDTLSQMDSLSRSGAVSDATVKSIQDLQDALNFSNVAKYADDLHINLQRLSEDLMQNGASGEYTTRILDQLQNQSHGFGAMLNAEASHILPGWTGSAEKAYDARKDLLELITRGKGVLGQSADATDGAAGADDKYARAAEKVARQQDQIKSHTQQVTAAMKEQRKATAEASQQWLGLGDGLNKAKVSLDDWIKHFAKQADALRNFRVNAQAAAKKGLDEGLIASLQAAGPEGALRMKQLADATKEQIARANEGFRSGQREAKKLTDTINGITSPKPVHVSVEAGGALTLLQQLQNFQFRDKYIKVHTVRSDSSGVDFMHGGTSHRDGGYTGNYPANQAVGVVHGGEFVMDAVSTARAGVANLYALQRQLRGYAAGGFVSTATPQPIRSERRTERVETVRTIVLDAGSLGRIVHDTATGVTRHEIAQHQRRESVVAGQ